jgi:hypothetical protein
MTKKYSDDRITPPHELILKGDNHPAVIDDDVRISLREWLMSNTVWGLRQRRKLADAASKLLHSLTILAGTHHKLENIEETLKKEDQLDKLKYQAEEKELEKDIKRKDFEIKRLKLEHEVEIERLRSMKREYKHGGKSHAQDKPKTPYDDIRDPKVRKAVMTVASFLSRNVEGQEYLDEFYKQFDELVKEGKMTKEQADAMKQDMQDIYLRTIDEG